MNKPDNIPELLLEIQKQATLYKAIYPDKTIQIQIFPLTLEFIKLYLVVNEGAMFEKKEDKKEPNKLFGFPLFMNEFLKGRYAIAVLEEEE